jgi:peptidoglycan/LPS O-acetylase OafA/YrhL
VNQWTYRPELDGLRSVAVYLVVLFHCGLASFAGGYVGVDLFFVLSGFLVSHVIWAEVDRAGSFRLGWFYARRVRRLLPAAVLVIVVTALIQLLVASEPQRAGMLRDGQSALVYLSNWQFIADARDYFTADGTDTSPYLHFWSLSIEEQFYVVLPLLLLVLLRLRRHVVVVLLLLTAVVAGSVALQVWYAQSDPTYAYYATQTRVYQLAAGVLLALITRLVTIKGVVGIPLAILGVVGIVVVGSGAVDVTPSTRGLLATAVSVAAVAGLYAAPSGPAARLLALPLPRYLGHISYGTYLWHWPLILVTRDVFDVRPIVIAAIAGTTATGLAALSYEVFERPIRRAKRLDLFPWPVVGAGLTASVLAAVLVLPPILHADVRPVLANPSAGDLSAIAADAAWVEEPVPADLDLAAALADVPDAGVPCTAEDLEVCVRVSGSGPRILLVGDSQAAMFVDALEALADEHDFTLLTNIVRGCGWQAGLVQDASPEEQAACTASRETFYADVLPQLDVDAVMTVSLARADDSWSTKLSDPEGPPGQTLEQMHARTASATAEAIRATGARLVMVKALLGTNGYERTGPDPLDCLARATRLGDCAVVPPLEKPFTDGILDAIAATTDETAAVDLNPVLCPDAPLCRPVSGDTVVWKDPDHVTGTFLVEQREALWQRLEDTGLFTSG